MPKRKKRLNVLNTQRIFNLTLIEKNDYVLDVSEDNYMSAWDKLAEHISQQDDLIPDRDGISYSIHYTSGIDYGFLVDALNYGANINIVTEGIIPEPLIDVMAHNDKVSHATYIFKPKYTTSEINNIQQAASAVDVDIVMDAYDTTRGYDIMISLSDVVFSVDNLIIHYKGDSLDREYELFNEIRDALSGWKIGIVYSVSSEIEKDYMNSRKKVDERLKKSSTVWVK